MIGYAYISSFITEIPQGSVCGPQHNAVCYSVPASLHVNSFVKQLSSLKIDQRRLSEEGAKQDQRPAPTDGGGPEDGRST